MNPARIEAMRKAMVDSQLRTNGVNVAWILEAMGSTPREAFVPAEYAATAYNDRSVPLGEGRYLSPPLATALMLKEAAVEPEDKVLLVGDAGGYVAALLAQRTKNLRVSGTAGGSLEGAPYTLIIIDGAIGHLPDALVQQLADGGRIVTGVCEGPVSRLAIGYRWGEHVSLRPFMDCEIAPLSAFAKPQEFAF